MTTETELLGCPFCGAAPYRSFSHDESIIWCPKCLASNVTAQVAIDGETKPAAIAAWNRRLLTPSGAGEGEVSDAAVEAAARALAHGETLSFNGTIEERAARIDKIWGRFKGEAKTALTAALPYLRPAQSQEGVKVKLLVWNDNAARSIVGVYRIVDASSFLGEARYDVWLDSSGSDEAEGVYLTGGFVHWAEASAASQADYETRIRSALIPQEGGE